ncbi:hypothetical protein CEUSTIGMA_g11028.t1 [Chlamydomonas eustigma]|uniref:TLC domain-containing protein n=1 Tax=Chlamydomonas eustigma TaxID=1157962 RepID=A0A250XKQ1_9CHLO|nr:hypothetical protein CEUSTIGMA_g11028.t1 [Chlamydomonas eustigma]|eukprot:GAX83603.1 hypothetical protein CEUSTIGMA_g11028.t1 [Chlamydomonas eustigma]
MNIYDVQLVLGLSLCFPLCKWTLDHSLFAYISETLIPAPSLHDQKNRSSQQLKPPSAENAGKNKLLLRKINEALWKLSCYGLFVLIGSLNTLRSEWFWRTKAYWQGWPHQEGMQPLRYQCALELSYYVSGVAMLLFEVSRKDQAMMMVHHCATIVLTGACYWYNYARAGCVIMLIHDINDVLMEVAKLCSYMKRETLAKVAFGLFVVCWMALRMVMFPTVIIRSTMFEVVEVLGYQPPMYWLINSLFVLLYCIHVYWFTLILRILWSVLVTGSGKDVREEEDE